jgi:hypothetical protein
MRPERATLCSHRSTPVRMSTRAGTPCDGGIALLELFAIATALVRASGGIRSRNTVPRHGTPWRWKEPSRPVLVFVLDRQMPR